ncbi:MAG: dicarboxylate/amino acid:cation symporter [Bacteroidia bacterium]
MKLYTKILIGMLLGTLVGALYSGLSQPGRFGRTDQDQDLRITWEEMQAASDRWIDSEAAFYSYDSNGDRAIDRQEYRDQFGWQRFTVYTDWVGTIFIRLVKMLVVPLVLVSLILGAAGLGNIRKIGKMGLRAFGFFLLTTAIAAGIGILVANIGQPGRGLPRERTDQLIAQYQDQASAQTQTAAAESMKQKSAFEKTIDLVVSLVPTNPFEALAKGDMLGVIFFALFLGVCMTLIPPDKSAPLIRAFDGLNDAVIKMVTLAMETAPYGVFALMLNVVANLGLDVLLVLVKYALVVLAGLALHVALTYNSIIFFMVRQHPLRFVRAIKEAIVMAFSTSSSSATLPVSMNIAETNLGVSRKVSSFVLPLGATINMDGTALYQAVAAIFIAQVFNIPLDMPAQLTIILTATLASVGAAGVPGAGMITLALVLSTLGIPETGIALIFGLDRILDMCRTVVNIVGDLTLTTLIAKWEGEDVIIDLDKDAIAG